MEGARPAVSPKANHVLARQPNMAREDSFVDQPRHTIHCSSPNLTATSHSFSHLLILVTISVKPRNPSTNLASTSRLARKHMTGAIGSHIDDGLGKF